MRFSREDISVLAGRIASGWRRAFEGLLSFLDEHAVGVLATLVIHLALIVIFLFNPSVSYNVFIFSVQYSCLAGSSL